MCRVLQHLLPLLVVPTGESFEHGGEYSSVVYVTTYYCYTCTASVHVVYSSSW